MANKTVDVSVCKIVLFNTLRIKHQQVLIDSNTHIAGLNNVGKTSFLRTLAYLFCGGRREALGLDDRMKSFNDFYFEHRDVNTPKLSMIVYEFKVVESVGDEQNVRYFTVTAYCPSKPRFLFVDCAYDPNNYIDLSEHQQWKSFSIIEDRLLDAVGRDVMRYHRTDSVEEFMSILFGCPSIKSFKSVRQATNPNMLRKFSYFVPRYSTDFDPSVAKAVISKVLTRIICPPNKKKDSLNDLMEHLLFDQDSGRINLQEVRGDIASYMVDFEAFRRWREPDSRSAQKAILSNYPLYVEARNSERTILGRLRYAYNSAKSRLSQIDVQLQAINGEIEALNAEITREKELYEPKKDELGKKISVLEDRIKELDRKKAKYDPYLIRKDEFEGISILESEKSALDGRLSVLKSSNSDIHSAFENAKKDLEKIYLDYFIGEYSSRKNALDVAVGLHEKELLKRLYDEDYQKVDAKYIDLRQSTASEIATLETRISECNKKIGKIREYTPLAKEIFSQKEAVSVIEGSIKEVKKDITSAKNAIEAKNKALENLPSQKENIYGYKIERLGEEVSAASSALEAIERSIAEFGDSFAGWLTENRPGWEDTLGKVVREDILAAKGLDPVLEGDGDTLYGIRLDTDGYEVSVNTLANLEELRERAKTRLADAKSAHGAAVSEAERWFAKESEAIHAEITRLGNEKRDNEEKMNSLESDLNVANAELARLNSEQMRLQNEMLQKLQKTLETSKEELAVKRQASTSIEIEIASEKAALKQAVEEEVKAYAATVETQKEELEEARRLKEETKNEGIRAAEAERDRRLKSEGIDVKEIEALQKKSDNLQKKIDTLKKEKDDFYSPAKRFMADEYVNYFDLTKQCKDCQEDYKRLIEDHTAFESRKNTELSVCTGRLNDLNTENTVLSTDVGNVEKRFHIGGSDVISELEAFRRKAFEEVVPTETSDKCSDLLNDMASNEYNVGERRARLNSSVKKLHNMLTEEQRKVFFDPGNDYTDESKDEMGRFSAMYDYIANNHADVILGSRQNQARILLYQLNSCTRSWKDYISEVDRQVIDINAELRNINFISNIHRIEIRNRKRSDSLLANLEAISSLADEALDQYDFFALKGNRFYSIMQDLYETLQSRSEPVLKAIDSIRLEMRMDEGMNTGEWFDTFEVGGSNGTRFFAKNFFYVALLKSLVRKFARDGWRTHFPLLFDEVGTLSNNYMEQFLKKAKEAGFNCITAQPSVSWNVDLSLYDQEYKMTASERYPNHVVIIDIFRKVNTFKGPGQE